MLFKKKNPFTRLKINKWFKTFYCPPEINTDPVSDTRARIKVIKKKFLSLSLSQMENEKKNIFEFILFEWWERIRTLIFINLFFLLTKRSNGGCYRGKKKSYWIKYLVVMCDVVKVSI